MIEFIPLEHYQRTVSSILLVFTLLTSLLFATYSFTVVERGNYRNRVSRTLASVTFALLIGLIGLRPISFAFGDMGNYYNDFLKYQSGATLSARDIGFEWLLWTFANYGTAAGFFFVCSTLYLAPMVMAFQRALRVYWPIAFFFATAQFDFYGYAVNGIRQGIATSLFLLAITARGPAAYILIGTAVAFHQSVLVSAIAYLIATRIVSPKFFLTLWSAALIATSSYAGFGELVASTGILGDRFENYLEVDDDFLDQFSAVGYRLDFILYSALPIVVGWYFLIRRRFADELYTRAFNIYLMCNAAWLLVIRVPASNRFAFLSWSLTALIVAYPFVKFNAFRRQNMVAALILTSLAIFTFTSHW